MPIFTGINNKAQNIEKIFVGVNGKAKEVKTAFVGVNGKAKQIYTAFEDPNVMTFNIGRGTFTLKISGEDLSLLINGEEQNVSSGIPFSKSIVNTGTAKLTASRITSISFENNTALRKIKNAFPLWSSDVDTFSNCFRRCTGLTTIPSNLFDNNTAVTDFNSCFYNCTSLTTIPSDLFDNNTAVTSFNGCFGGCTSLTSTVPTLWDETKWPEVALYNRCFRDCTSAANYADIPSDWK